MGRQKKSELQHNCEGECADGPTGKEQPATVRASGVSCASGSLVQANERTSVCNGGTMCNRRVLTGVTYRDVLDQKHQRCIGHAIVCAHATALFETLIETST